MIIERIFDSSSSDAKHKCRFDTETGKGVCSCRGWRASASRECRHVKEMAGTSTVAAPPKPGLTASTTAIPVRPMLASAMTKGTLKDFATSAWCLEEKFDGHRVIVKVSGSTPVAKVTAWSRPRSGKDALSRELPPHISAAFAKLPNGIYDGELMASCERSRSSKVRQTELQSELIFVVFDALDILGTSMLKTPYLDRRAALKLAVSHYGDVTETPFGGLHAGPLHVPAAVPVSAAAVAAIMDRGGEGAILKRTASLYQSNRRSPDWVKVKRSGSVVMTITGFEAGKSGPHSVALGTSPDGRDMRVKTKDNATRDDIAKNEAKYIGKRLVVAYTERSEDGAYLNATWDHLAGKGE